MSDTRSSVGWIFERLAKHHERGGFSCGLEALDDYLKRRAGQELRRGVTFPYVLTRGDDPKVLAYYTLSATSIALTDLPPAMAKQLGYPAAPAALIGRLAVDQSVQGKGIEKLVLVNALRRLSASDAMAIMLVVVDPKDDAATRFYTRLGFSPLNENESENERRMYLPFKTIKQL